MRNRAFDPLRTMALIGVLFFLLGFVVPVVKHFVGFGSVDPITLQHSQRTAS